MSLLDPQPNYAEHDTFLHALLGVAYANEALRNLLKTATADLSIENPRAELAQREDQQFVDAILGLAALAETADGVIKSWQVPLSETSIDAPGRPLGFDAIGDIMR